MPSNATRPTWNSGKGKQRSKKRRSFSLFIWNYTIEIKQLFREFSKLFSEYRFIGLRHEITEICSINRKHRSNWTATLSENYNLSLMCYSLFASADWGTSAGPCTQYWWRCFRGSWSPKWEPPGSCGLGASARCSMWCGYWTGYTWLTRYENLVNLWWIAWLTWVYLLQVRSRSGWKWDLISTECLKMYTFDFQTAFEEA